MSDSKKYPSLPPDDFSKTTPNIPRADEMESSDWEKTNYNAKFAPQPPADDWGKTVSNIPPVKNEPDFNQTYMPSAQNPKTPDWGVTDTNIKLPNHDFSNEQQDQGNRTAYGATSPFIQLPEAERAKYQNLPPTPTQAAAQKSEDDKKKGGIPAWFWAVGGLLTLFFFAIITIILVYVFFLRPTGFEIVIQSAPPRSEIWIDNTRWSVTEGDGTLRAKGLKSSELKKLEIRNPGFTCEPREIEGKDGETVTITARCTQNGGVQTQNTPVNNNGNDCQNIRLGEFDKAESCANAALDALPPAPNYTAEQLTKSLNIFIINFDSGKFTIPSARQKFLERAAGFIKNLPSYTILEVGGHTDDKNTDAYNQVLSENRAKAVKDALVKFGVRSDALQTKGYGKNSPKVPNNSEENRFFNRRIEYKVIQK